MKTHAIVIGIDHYANPDWRLRGAVRDALAFAGWVDGHTEAPVTRQLLVEPAPQAAPAGWTIAAPTRDNILDAVADAIANAGGADRLLFFYAGHAATPANNAPEDGPVLVPTNCKRRDELAERGVHLGVQLHKLRAGGPLHQYFFVDGCRDIVEPPGAVAAAQAATWDLTKLPTNLATQGVLYATTTGKWSNELGGRGLFTRALLEGLSGKGPRLSLDGDNRECLAFAELGDFVKARVVRRLQEKHVDSRAWKAQSPTWGITPGNAKPVLCIYEPAVTPRVQLRVRVEPASARRNAVFEPLDYNRIQRRYVPLDSIAADGAAVMTLALPAGPTRLRIRAEDFEPREEPRVLDGDDSLFIVLEASDGLESFGEPPKRRLTLVSRDPQVRIAISDATGQACATGRGELSTQLSPGGYFVDISLPGVPHRRDAITHGPGDTRIELGVLSRPGVRMMEAMARADIAPDGAGYAHPAEHLIAVADMRLSSMLAYAAWGAAWRAAGHDGGFYKMSQWGLAHAAPAVSGGTVTVLVGDVSLRPKDGRWLFDACSFEIVRDGAATPMLLSPPLAGLGFVRQSSVPLSAGGFLLRTAAPGVEPTFVATAVVEGFATVVVLTREEWGEVEMSVFLMPLDPTQGVRGLPAPDPSDIRIHDLAMRALGDGSALLPGEYRSRATGDDPVASGLWSNPLAAVIAGYRLAKERRFAELAPTLRELLPRFDELSDLHLLAAWEAEARADRATAEQHFARAAAGLPVVAAGVRALLTTPSHQPGVPPGLGLFPCTVWTTLGGVAPPDPSPPAAPRVPSAPMAEEWFTPDEIDELHWTIVSLGLAGQRSALLAGIDAAIVGAIPTAQNASGQARIDLATLNATDLAAGSEPFQRLLRNADALSRSRKGNAVFVKALAKLRAG